MNTSLPISVLLVLSAAACAPDSGDTNPRATQASPAIKPLSERLSENNGYQQDADGNWKPKSDKRSSFESQEQNAQFQGDYQKKTYQTGDYAKKSWWGNKQYGHKEYSGNTDASRFQKTSRFAGKGAREAKQSAEIAGPFTTGTYATQAAREAGNGSISKPSDTETDVRRRVFIQPEVIDWREQRSLSLEQSKGILGR